MKVRSLIRGIAAVAVLAAPLAGLVPVPSTSGLLPVPGIIDLSVDVESKPGTVAPPGEGVIYRVTVSNAIISLGGGATVTGTLPTGFTFAGGDGCSASGADVTCVIPSIAPGTSEVVDIRAFTSTTVGVYSFTVNVTSNDVTEPLEHTANNSDTTTTSVEPDDGGDSIAFVCGGCSLPFSDPDVGAAELFVPLSSPGVFVRLEQDDQFTGLPCGESPTDGTTCNPALGIVFVESDEEPEYQALDPNDPIRVEYTPKQLPCSGAGAPACAPIGAYDPSKDVRPTPIDDCDGAGSGVNPGDGRALVNGAYQVCKDQTKKTGSLVTHVVLMKSTDPLIPPLSLPKG